MPPKRVKNISISRPIIFGNTATPLPKDPAKRPKDTPPDHTHSWTIFVRDPSGGDLSPFIKKVVFKLHDTYANSLRTVESSPFEVTETGWGEFEITIRIFFVPEASEKNLTIYHHLKLHPYVPGTTGAAVPKLEDGVVHEPPDNAEEVTSNIATSSTGVVESIYYDEVVFNEPTEEFFEILAKHPVILPAKRKKGVKFCTQTENEELDRISAGMEKVYSQIQVQKDKIAALLKEKAALSA